VRLGWAPPYKPLDTHAILARFRPVAIRDERSVLDVARAIIFTMSTSPRFQQSSKIRAGVELFAAHRRSKAPGSSETPSVKPALPFRNC